MTVGVLLALASAFCYGVSDFAGGLLSRRAPFAVIALTGQVGGLLLAVAAVPFIPAPAVAVADLGWGALSGVGTGIGMLFLFRGVGRGAMSVVVPISAVGGVAIPVLIGVLVLGERPSALGWLGVTAALPALWLVSRSSASGEAGVAGAPDGMIAGLGIALQYVALAQAAPGAGGWPVVAGRVAAIATIVPLIVHTRSRLFTGTTLPAAATGAAAALALALYLAATRQQLVVIAVVLSSVYPAIPVLLGIWLLRERLSKRQVFGLAAATASVALLVSA